MSKTRINICGYFLDTHLYTYTRVPILWVALIYREILYINNELSLAGGQT